MLVDNSMLPSTKPFPKACRSRLPLSLLLLFWLSFQAQRGTCCLPFFASATANVKRSSLWAHLEAIPQSCLNTSTIISSIGYPKERRTQHSTDLRHVGMVQQIRRTDIHQQALLMRCLWIVCQRKGTLQISIEVNRPRHDTLVARENTFATRSHQQSVTRGNRSRRSGDSILRTVVEVSVAVVIEARRDVVVPIATTMEIRAEFNLLRKGKGTVAEDVPDSLIRAMSELPCIGQRTLRRSQFVIVRIVYDIDPYPTEEELHMLQGVLFNPHEDGIDPS